MQTRCTFTLKEMLEESRTLFEHPVAIALSTHEEKEIPKELAGVPRHLNEGVGAKEHDKAVKLNFIYISMSYIK